MLCAESPLYGTFIPHPHCEKVEDPASERKGREGKKGEKGGGGLERPEGGREKDEGIGERLDGRDGEEREG